MTLFFWLSIITFLVLLISGIVGVRGATRIKWLDAVRPLADSKMPSVSIVIPALNEEKNIREALLSVLSLDYRPLQIIIINDRSTDGTGEFLEEMAASYPLLKVVHLHKLPDGWLGKNHALQCGADLARGDYLLFTDADVIMEPSTLRLAMSRMLSNKLDHLTLFFKALLPSGLLRMVVIEFGVSLISYLKPWKANDPAAPHFIGIGAFNLVKAEAYRKAGGHRAIRLCPLDDIMLGKLMKAHHFRQECLYGYHHIAVKWYGSVREMTSGLMKNTYAALQYSFLRLCLLSLMQLAVSIWPFWALMFTEGITFLLNVAIIMTQGGLFVMAAVYSDMHWKHVAWFPLTPYIRLYMTWKAVLVTLFKGGINWRGTFYPLKDLKESKKAL